MTAATMRRLAAPMGALVATIAALTGTASVPMGYTKNPGDIGSWTWVEQAKLQVSGTKTFGTSVSLDGNTAVIGAGHTTGSLMGGAYVFVRSGTLWSEQAVLTASDAASADDFGCAVSISGDTVIVGSDEDDDWGSSSGSAYIFVRQGTTWIQQAKITASDGAAGAYFGRSVSVYQDTALVGAYRASLDYGDHRGAAYVFVRTGTTWSQAAKLVAPDSSSFDEFGCSVAIRGGTVLVGAHQDDDLGGESGAAYIFTCDSTGWSATAKLTASDGDTLDWFGCSVALDDNSALIGAYGDHDYGAYTGAAYVFVRAGSTWIQEAKLTAADGAPRFFGDAVSICGDTALIGAYRDDDAGVNAGAAYVFERCGGVWDQSAKLIASDGTQGDQFSRRAVAVSGNAALIGARMDDHVANYAGSAYVFVRQASAAAVYRNDGGDTNEAGYAAALPVLGADWTATVDNARTGNFVAGVMGYAHPLELYIPGADDYLLIDPHSPGGELLHLPPAYGYGVVTFSALIPDDVALMGFTLCTQGGGFGGGGGTTLHNAYDLFVGQ